MGRCSGYSAPHAQSVCESVLQSKARVEYLYVYAHRTQYGVEFYGRLISHCPSEWYRVCLSALKPLGYRDGRVYIQSIRLCNGAVLWFLFGFCFAKGRLGPEQRWARNGRRGDKGMKKGNGRGRKRDQEGIKKGSRRDLEKEQTKNENASQFTNHYQHILYSDREERISKIRPMRMI